MFPFLFPRILRAWKGRKFLVFGGFPWFQKQSREDPGLDVLAYPQTILRRSWGIDLISRQNFPCVDFKSSLALFFFTVRQSISHLRSVLDLIPCRMAEGVVRKNAVKTPKNVEYVENRECFGGFFCGFFLLVFQGKWSEKSTRKSSKKSTAETKLQKPRVFSGKGCPWTLYVFVDRLCLSCWNAEFALDIRWVAAIEMKTAFR